ncbi:lasso RiPP family leader peptide-containing protein [Streptomyces spirodelae]|uniref:Lasso RiPP family leader peptide-containing protein n=1 Tax=Streptomyces spirodelae TaxID=2812904 RepID=A0ABS3WPZ3_9ACTN|nr:lasso RiPP family leader peptide-containing protein [Streptomyces spirodelae]MBO8185189.1 lasso RiPP family leader peptide-containing protein [Streptomyces spirodelae]
MSEEFAFAFAFEFEAGEVYEPPMLVESGDYTEVTNGFHGWHWDTFGGHGRGWW